MGAVASQITSLTIVYSTVYSDIDQRKHQSSASLAFARGIYKWPVTRKMFPFDDVIMHDLSWIMYTQHGCDHWEALSPGPLFTKRTGVLPRDLVKSRDSYLDISNRSEISQAPRQLRYRDACHISERYDHYHTQTRGFETSRYLTVRHHLLGEWRSLGFFYLQLHEWLIKSHS